MPGQGEDQGQGLHWICAHYGKAALQLPECPSTPSGFISGVQDSERIIYQGPILEYEHWSVLCVSAKGTGTVPPCQSAYINKLNRFC